MNGKIMTLSDSAFFELWKTLPCGSAFCVEASGRSMEPLFINRCSRVFFTKPESGTAVKRGDVIIFTRQGLFPVLHRVFAINCDGTLKVTGDAQTVFETVNKSEVCGIMTGFIRRRRYRTRKNILYRFYCGTWRFLFPLRGVLIKIYRKFLKLGEK